MALPLSASGAISAGCGAQGSTGTGGSVAAQSSSSSSGGGKGGSSASSSSSSSSSGTGGAPGCMSDADCTKNPKKPICDTTTGDCVGCLPANDMCPMGKYCDPTTNNCEQGCTDQTDCTGMTVCDPIMHKCVGCAVDDDCPLGSVCAADNSCTPGCTAAHGCAGSDTCCASTCVDLSTDLVNCGMCGKSCPVPSESTPTCNLGKCGYTCLSAFLDCNLDGKDGCEWNGLQDGPCLCKPGDTQTCYNGPPGTLNKGECKAGIRTCNPDGVSWGACTGEVLPAPQQCVGKDEDCDGVGPPKGCSPCVIGTGSCNGNVSTYCPDGLGNVTEVCDPLEGLVCNPMTFRCEGVCSSQALGTSNIGCDYFPTVTANLVDSSIFHFAVAISNTTPNDATVTISKGAMITNTITVAANSVQIVQLPWDNTLKGPSSNAVTPMPSSIRVNAGAYRIRSNQPVSVYQFNPLEYQIGGSFSYTNDASMLLPTNVWTGTYRVAARHHFAGGSGFYAVVARDDNTTVTVSPPPGGVMVKSGIQGINTDDTGSVVLNAGDVIEVVTNGSSSQSDPNDVTGTLVSADKPVQVIGGHQCIYIPDSTGYCDHLEESMFPYETLSTAYIVTAPLIPPGAATPKVRVVRIVATKPNTTLSYDPPQPGAPASISAAGGWVELSGNVNNFQITASDPILVAEYMEGQDAGGAIGDPAMALAVAKDQYRSSYLFHSPTNYSSSYVNVVAPTGAVVTLDGAAVGPFTPIGNSGFSLARMSVSNAGNGNHSIVGSQPFGITVYGYGQYTSYWYAGGTLLIKLHN